MGVKEGPRVRDIETETGRAESYSVSESVGEYTNHSSHRTRTPQDVNPL